MCSEQSYRYSHQAVRDYALSFHNDSGLISNVEAEIDTLTLSAQMILPITINDSEYHNSYVCSPYTALVPYCREELAKVGSVLIRGFISALLSVFDVILKKSDINKIYQLNNWLLSTNLYPLSLNRSEIAASKLVVTASYPEHLLMYRSLNFHSNEKLIACFTEQGFSLVPSRQVYIFDKRIKDYSKSHNYKMDKKFLEKTSYKYVSQDEILTSDIPRIVALYNLLYIDKYSVHNPQFTDSFIASILEHPNFYLEGFRSSDGILDAVGGRFEMDGVVTLPIVGYDTGKPKSLGLYRLVMMSSLQYSEQANLVFNASSGASSFKYLRGAVAFIEYSAIYANHLPVFRRAIWRLLKVLLQYTFIPIIQRYKL